LKGIDKEKRAANIIRIEDIGVAKLNVRKESKFSNERINRIRLTSFIAHIYRRSDIRIFKNQYIFEYVSLTL
jgi:hypothetical protein